MSLIKGTINIIYNYATLFDVINKKIHELNIVDNKSKYYLVIILEFHYILK